LALKCGNSLIRVLKTCLPRDHAFDALHAFLPLPNPLEWLVQAQKISNQVLGLDLILWITSNLIQSLSQAGLACGAKEKAKPRRQLDHYLLHPQPSLQLHDLQILFGMGLVSKSWSLGL